ncbi:hypothetical protein [Elizabethkingia miricola]|uniref:hypothetical protein n=1 Tax=Elizabethkingia miricola TaxID=172045 RepID=UPI00099A309B|nr:hypothetical protein [Elizabethkingia miricola]OPC14396.1 hypothetical protein BAY01_08385 [Elizabethkingia miricola]
MLTKEELTEAYKKFNDHKIESLALKESKSLREDAIPILENEIRERKLDSKLLDWIKHERNFFIGAELQDIKKIIQNSECSECRKESNNLQGFKIHYFSVLSFKFDSEIIVCENCGRKLRHKSYIKTATLGFLSTRGIINVPSYFIMELIASLSRQKTSERIINEFIFQNTGSIRKHGNDEVPKLITKHNIQQVEQNKYS